MRQSARNQAAEEIDRLHSGIIEAKRQKHEGERYRRYAAR